MATPTFPSIAASALPVLSTEQMRAVDRLMIEDYHIQLLQMMENAGLHLAELTHALLGGQVEERSLVVLAGRGNNGGGGLVAARHLHNRGALVQVITAYDLDDYSGVPAHQLQILLAMGVSVSPAEPGWALPPADFLLDALIGYGLQGPPRGMIADLIRWANAHPAPVLALDAPSGLDTSTGQVYDPCMQATATMTLALPKAGLLRAPAANVGDLYLADISVPPELYEELGIELAPLFGAGPILAVR